MGKNIQLGLELREQNRAQPKLRLIGRLDIKGEKLIKHIQLEGVQQIGDPSEKARQYYREGIDEILLIDAVASLYGRNHLGPVIESIAKQVFIPLTVGGGIRSVADVDSILRSGADKVAINTALLERPKMVSEIAAAFGSQCLVVQIDAKKKSSDHWEPYSNGAREPSGKNLIDWIKQVQDLGAGELLVTSIDHEGLGNGVDNGMISAICSVAKVPIVISGGVGAAEHMVDAYDINAISGFAMSYLLHIGKQRIASIKEDLRQRCVPVRLV